MKTWWWLRCYLPPGKIYQGATLHLGGRNLRSNPLLPPRAPSAIARRSWLVLFVAKQSNKPARFHGAACAVPYIPSHSPLIRLLMCLAPVRPEIGQLPRLLLLSFIFIPAAVAIGVACSGPPESDSHLRHSCCWAVATPPPCVPLRFLV